MDDSNVSNAMEWNVEINEWRKMDFSWKSSENKHKASTICQRVNIVWLCGRREYVSQLSCNFITTSLFLKAMMMYLWPLLR